MIRAISAIAVLAVAVLALSAVPPPLPAAAQSGYTPPPMFGAQQAPAAPEPARQPAEPVAVKPPPLPEHRQEKHVPAPAPRAARPSDPVIESLLAYPVRTGEAAQSGISTRKLKGARPLPPLPARKPNTAPARAVMASYTPDTAMPEPRVREINMDSESVVKGPKTMPAVPPGPVEARAIVDEETGEMPPVSRRPERQARLFTDDLDMLESSSGTGGARPENKPKNGKVVSLDAEERVQFYFSSGDTELTSDMPPILERHVLSRLRSEEDTRLQIKSFATPADDGQSSARRISLARALSMRAYLLDQGIAPKRIDIRALGDDSGRTKSDRVDIVFLP